MKNSQNLRDMCHLPVYQKSVDILEMVETFVEILPDDIEELEFITSGMIENAYLIPSKIVGAEAGDLYDIRMENATLIRLYARELQIAVHSFKLFQIELSQIEYYQLIRNEIEEFRVLFVEWVKTFDSNNYVFDRWGLFNPPGADYDDEETDGDPNFDPSKFFDNIDFSDD